MKRFARVASVCVVGLVCASAAAHAQTTQTTTAPGSTVSDPRVYVEFHGGPTLGHKSDTFIGGEGGLRLVQGLDVFVEGGHMSNVGTSKLESLASGIAGAVGATVGSTAYIVDYVTAGVRYHLNMLPMAHPYVLVGAGLGKVKAETTFAVNGTEVSAAQLGISLGGDLSGSNNKTMIVGGFGVNVPFMKRFYADLGYRYGAILAKTDLVENDQLIKTQRIVLGVGVKF